MGHEFDEDEWLEVRAEMDRMKGTIKSSDCLNCGAKNGMVYEGDCCFVCHKCNYSVAEDVMYLEILGYDTSPIDE